MSQEFYVFLKRSDMPTPEQWQQAITKSGFELQLDHDFDPFVFTGFLPCKLSGNVTGFEYYFSAKGDIAGPETYLAASTTPFDSVVTFVWGGNLTEMAAVMMAAGSLADSCPSLMHDPQDDSSINNEDALGYARQQLAAIQSFLK
jgi:hypothetical protein